MVDAVDLLRRRGTSIHKIVQHVHIDHVQTWNEQYVLNLLRREGPLARTEIATRLQITRATAGILISNLLERGLVEEYDAQPVATNSGKRSVGKPATKVRFKADAGYIIGVGIGRSHLTVLVRDLDGNGPDARKPREMVQEGLDNDPWHLSEAFETSSGAEVCLRLIASRLYYLLDNNGLDWEKVVGIGLALPGTLDTYRSKLARPWMMPKWEDIDIPTTLRNVLNLQGQSKLPIYLGNDANLGALGESRYGAGRDSERLVYIKIGSGTGAGLFLDGHLYRGERSLAGEFGHQIVDPDGPKCEGCGNSGCLETLTSEQAIVQTAQLASSASVADVVRLAEAGNEQCRLALQQAGKQIGFAIANLINVIDPERVLLGGSVIRDAWDCDFFRLPLLDCANCCVPAAKNTPIHAGMLGKYSIAYGAIVSVIDEVFRDPVLGYIPDE